MTTTTVTLDNGDRVVLPTSGEYLHVTKDGRKGALEGLLGGAVMGMLVAGIIMAKADTDCSAGRGGCVNSVPGLFAVTIALHAAIGAIYGAAKGNTTTYRWGPTP